MSPVTRHDFGASARTSVITLGLVPLSPCFSLSPAVVTPFALVNRPMAGV